MSRILLALRRLLPCLLALCLSGTGPATLAALPRALNVGQEEETRSHVEHTVGGLASAGIRMPRTNGDRCRARLSGSGERPRIGVRGYGAAPTVAFSLCALQVRIQV